MHPVKFEAIVIVQSRYSKDLFRKYATSFILLLSIDGSFVTTNCEICKGPNQMTPQSSVDVATTDSRKKYEIGIVPGPALEQGTIFQRSG